MSKVQLDDGVLHTKSAMRRTWFNRLFAATYLISIFALIFHHCHNIVSSTDHRTTRKTTIIMLVADLVLAFMWFTRQAFRMSPVRREVFPENLTVDESEYPALDVFVCTADPYKEPPIGVVNTVLSLMAYDYPTDKLSVYVSDDGGSQLTLFALMEAAEFAKHWLPYCNKHSLLDRAPEAYFASQTNFSPAKHDQIKVMYQRMKMRINNVVQRGSIDGYVTDKEAHRVFALWQNTPVFTLRSHPSVVQVVMEGATEKHNGHQMPNLVYVSREKTKSTFHNYKAGALNVLLRVSATMTNAPIVLTQDCDMFSNDPKTPLRVLCYFTDPKMDPNLALVQFPQTFHGINKDDIYSAEVRDVVLHNCYGYDGILGPTYMGSGAFFRRNVLFGSPGSHIPLQTSDTINKSISSVEVMTMARHVAGCNFEAQSKWGSEVRLFGTYFTNTYSLIYHR
ncbi:cellulose synthase-like protein G3 [Apium graveolens]|uniref:cellulose synthase-like protein G3 n=1 Tax=Apium graveolens TaxID=4045 RepID=UPI003D7B2F41